MKKQKKASKEVRIQFPIRISRDEQDRIAKAARRVGLPASTWVRVVALEAANRILSSE